MRYDLAEPDNEPDELCDFTVTLSAYRNPSRLSRLAMLARHCFAADSAIPIEALSDHKGALFVLWSEVPTVRQVAQLTYAWEDMCEFDVTHQVPSERHELQQLHRQDIHGLHRGMLQSERQNPDGPGGMLVRDLLDTLDVFQWIGLCGREPTQ